MGAAAQINPPYDGSAPCPACQQDLRSISAYLHNFLTRCSRDGARIEQNKAFVRLVDMRAGGLPRELSVPNPAAQEVVDVCRALLQAIEGIQVDSDGTIRWTPEIRAGVEALIPRAMSAADAYAALSEAHFADRRHSHGEPNVIRESRGSKWAGFANPDYEAAKYDHTVVEVIGGPANIRHTVCGVGLRLHEHFKANLRRDPTFYGKVWCPRCKGEVPFAQFVCEVA